MKHPYWLPMSAALLAMALAVSLPSAAKSQGHGQHRGGGHSSVGDGGRSHSGNHGSARGGGHSSVGGGGRSYSGNHGSTRGGERRSYGGDRGSWRGSDSRGSYRGDVRYRDPRSDHRADQRWRDAGRGGRGEVRYRDPRSDHRADQRWRDAGHRGRGVRDGRTYHRDGRYYGGDHRPTYSTRTRYRHGGPSYSYHRPHHYYTAYFHRPHFVYRSGFSLGFVIGLVPSYGYRYFDPYCDIGFSHLSAYYDHCYDRGHPEVILVVDASGYPIATCVYRDGAWVVDDRYDDRY